MPKGVASYTADTGAFLLLQGEPGAGKSTVVQQLLNSDAVDVGTGQPFNLHVVDADRGFSGAALSWGAAGAPRPAAETDRLWYIQPHDKVELSEHGFAVTVGVPRAWSRVRNLVARWGEGPDRAKPYHEWTSADVVVFDSISSLVPFIVQDVLQDRAGGYRNKTGKLLRGNIQDIGFEQQMLSEFISAWHSMTPRRFHVVFTCHVKNKSLNLSKYATDDEVAAAIKDQKEAKKLADAQKMGDEAFVSVQTVRKWPVLIGNAMDDTFGRYFDFAYVARDALGAPTVYLRETEEYAVRVRPGLPPKLRGDTALATMLNHHTMLGKAAK